jgi:hypothetical protein
MKYVKSRYASKKSINNNQESICVIMAHYNVPQALKFSSVLFRDRAPRIPCSQIRQARNVPPAGQGCSRKNHHYYT